MAHPSIVAHVTRAETTARSAGHRWWTTGELRATGDRIVPAGLGDLLDSLASDDVPAAPVRLPWDG